MDLLDVTDLSAAETRAIWALANAPLRSLSGTVAWSFEGNGIRTRTTFIEAFRELGLAYVELPNLLKTSERACDLAGYLDPFYAMYVVRESNHERLQEFAAASSRPVINAMSRAAHPCEVLSDAYYIDFKIRPIESVRIGLWGPTTNVFRSWHALASVFGIEIQHFCSSEFHSENCNVVFNTGPTETVDILVTDGWPNEFNDSAWSLTREHLARLGNPKLLPTPPFSIGREVGFDPIAYEGFVGYEQKRVLLSVQRAILMHAKG
ncbi:ornithine carbamoyltransferase [Oryzisolibacter propanilivorax]|uniref:Ornithine carbamoyltransferase n=1 Tax=Oryzisolibacter propanilivorax TaxID=1527607 RepID=A0A1G9S760_9BURK|nr:ornithine carbamoyltransferase [Oryzisolibacter propanilivorax]SDM31241.1 ornithine carbamoyltransferase [Oryzisolibacter propanilivorax]